MNILYLLDQLEDLLKDSSKVPMTSRVLVDEQDMMDLIDQIRVSIPDEIKEATRLTRQRDQLLEDARAEADRQIREADAVIAERLAEHHLVRSAETRAAQIEERAHEQADRVRRESDEYAYRVMQRLREQIAQISQTVDRGILELQSHDARREVADRV